MNQRGDATPGEQRQKTRRNQSAAFKARVALVAILDLYSRKVLAHRLSNTMATDFCVEALEEAILRFGRPEVCNTDQGAQSIDAEFAGKLKAHGIAITLDGKGRWIDNVSLERLWRSVKYEHVYLRAYESLTEAHRD